MTDADPYDVEFDWNGAHGHLVTLLVVRPGRGVVVDLGCGYAPHAETLRDAGFDYVGFDVDATSLAAVERRGFAVERLDLGDVDATMLALDGVRSQGQRPVVAILAIDVIEHLTEPHVFVARLSEWMQMSCPDAVLGVSVPNVAHRDIAHKLLSGRWDVTRSGLLDHTHLRFFTDRSLTAVMGAAGFVETARNDRAATESDQHRPANSPLLAADASLAMFLRSIRDRCDDHGDTYQFIRLYHAVESGSEPTLITDRGEPPAVFLSVLVDPTHVPADTVDLGALRVALGAQGNDDWELVEPTAANVTLTELIDRSRGVYLSILGPGECPAPTWVADLAAGAGRGAILRCAVEPVGGVHEPVVIPGLEELGDVDRPGASLAFPAAAARMCSADVDDRLHGSLSLLLDLFQMCGVVDIAAAPVPFTSHRSVDRDALDERVARIDSAPFLSSPGSIARRRDAGVGSAASERIAELERDVDALRADNAWLNSELSLTPIRALRRLLRRAPSRR